MCEFEQGAGERSAIATRPLDVAMLEQLVWMLGVRIQSGNELVRRTREQTASVRRLRGQVNRTEAELGRIRGEMNRRIAVLAEMRRDLERGLS
ncbi:hypothetical protein SCOR_34440 [Sulfidibacter corallicola]|uniref:Uncharacterized protein n=1 Tax=Sulfidibacter corallicola TaxID=2818388 RepID=A0A8A4TJI2_SULCO|nr:hypothetical protein [Sulfidibacter corallicola]QTD49364.1 hypothetical protein J3U87_27585 [Sulfidibacter corallicola]